MIRPYEPSDKDTILRIWRESSAIAHPFLSPEQVDEANTMIRDHFLDIAEVWIAMDSAHPVAFIALLGTEVGGLFVLPEHQSKGHGCRLLDHVAQTRPTLTLAVFGANSSARRFYEAYGFKAMHEQISGTFGHPEISMTLSRA